MSTIHCFAQTSTGGHECPPYGIAYAVATWLLIQVTDIVFPRIGLPDSAVTLAIALLVIGFIPVLNLAWALEMTPDGIKREKEVDWFAGHDAPTPGSGTKP
jgi:hypothetical protein